MLKLGAYGIIEQLVHSINFHALLVVMGLSYMLQTTISFTTVYISIVGNRDQNIISNINI